MLNKQLNYNNILDNEYLVELIDQFLSINDSNKFSLTSKVINNSLRNGCYKIRYAIYKKSDMLGQQKLIVLGKDLSSFVKAEYAYKTTSHIKMLEKINTINNQEIYLGIEINSKNNFKEYIELMQEIFKKNSMLQDKIKIIISINIVTQIIRAVLNGASDNISNLNGSNVNLYDNVQFMMALISKNPVAFFMASVRLKGDKKFVMCVVKMNANALKIISDELRRDKEVCLTAVKENSSAYKWVDISLKQDPDILNAKLRRVSHVYHLENNDIISSRCCAIL